jgi:hypothetical protein
MQSERDLHMPPIFSNAGIQFLRRAWVESRAQSSSQRSLRPAPMASWTCCETPDLIARQIDAVRMRTNEPFGVNLIPAATDPGLLKAELSLRDNDLQNTCARFRCALSLANRF